MFQVDGEYVNRKGKYRVLAITPPKMRVRFEDGTVAELNILIQERIWRNILTEIEAAQRKSLSRRRSTNLNARFYVRAMSLFEVEDLSVAALRERVSYIASDAPDVASGDRFIFYAIEAQVFFGVATATGVPAETSRKIPYYNPASAGPLRVIPFDWDAQVSQLEKGVPLDSVELESQPAFKQLLQRPDVFLPVSEDDFELLAELLTELSEDEDDELDEDEEEEEEEDVE